MPCLLGINEAAADVAIAQFQPVFPGRMQFALPRRPGADSESAEDESGGTASTTDRELQRLLMRAEQFASEKRYDLAVVLWQKVLDGAGAGTLIRDDRIVPYKEGYVKYRTVADRIERMLAGLPADGLETYRLTVDGEANALLDRGRTGERDKVLSRVVQRFFLSSYGDDAAFKLGCLELDRHEFVGASRLFTKLLERYPDSSVPRDRVLLRLAVANARLGDFEAAGEALAELQKLPQTRTLQRVLALVEEDVERSRTQAVSVTRATDGWHMLYGDASRRGYMKPLPPAATAATLSELWSRKFDVSLSPLPVAPVQHMRGFGGGGGGIGFFAVRGRIMIERPSVVASATSTSLADRWKQTGWVPAGHLLLEDGRVYFKTADRLVCCDAASGRVIWMGRENRFQLDAVSQRYAAASRNQAAATGRPRSATDVFLFGDRVHHSMAIADRLILAIEGSLLLGSAGNSPASSQPSASNLHQNSMPRRGRRNRLAAYDAKNGKFKWSRTAAENDEQAKIGFGFLAAPVPYGDRLIAPVTGNGELWLVAMKMGSEWNNYENGGETVWRTYLCDEPPGGCSPWSPVGVAVDGGDAYVATGAGAVFAVDAMSGDIFWSLSYERSGQPDLRFAKRSRGGGGTPRLRLDGWDEDVVIPYGRHLVVMASDCSHLFAVDRRTGKFLWDSPRIPSDEDPPARYCLGAVGDALYVAGKSVVRRYDIRSGRLTWQTRIDESLGRGALTADSIYLPVKDSVLRLDLEKGRDRSQVGVVSPSGEPVGNIFSDGKRLLVVGLGRVYALTDLNRRLRELTALVEAGDGRAQFERMRLRNRLGKRDEAIDDLREGFSRLLKRKNPVESARALYDGLEELSLAGSHPQLSLELLAAAGESARNSPAHVQDVLEGLRSQQTSLLFTALRVVERKRIRGTAAIVLRVAPLFANEHQLTAVSRALAATARKQDAEMLRTALGSEDARVRLVATAGLQPVFGKEAVVLAKQLLADESHSVRLAAALSLADRGERAVLPVFARLLESDDLRVRARSAKALRVLTGQLFNFAAYESAESRNTAVKAWKTWIAQHGKTAKLIYPLRKLLGRTLIANHRSNQVIEIDSKDVVKWQQTVLGCYGCQGLPNGHRLVSSYQGKFIAEYDGAGDEVWKLELPAGQPFSVRRLDNGNTLVACNNIHKVFEFKRDGPPEPIWQVTVAANPVDARRLENGNTLICLLGGDRVIEVDRSGREVWAVGNMANPRSAQRLENGNTLVSQSSRGRIVELDPAGLKEVWSKEGLGNPTDAQRLPNGNTLIVHSRGLMEVDPDGDPVWERAEQGIGRASRF